MGGKELREIFGKNVKLYRSRRNWSQADLAEYANISINFLGDIERGKRRLIDKQENLNDIISRR